MATIVHTLWLFSCNDLALFSCNRLFTDQSNTCIAGTTHSLNASCSDIITVPLFFSLQTQTAPASK